MKLNPSTHCLICHLAHSECAHRGVMTRDGKPTHVGAFEVRTVEGVIASSADCYRGQDNCWWPKDCCDECAKTYAECGCDLGMRWARANVRAAVVLRHSALKAAS